MRITLVCLALLIPANTAAEQPAEVQDYSDAAAALYQHIKKAAPHLQPKAVLMNLAYDQALDNAFTKENDNVDYRGADTTKRSQCAHVEGLMEYFYRTLTPNAANPIFLHAAEDMKKYGYNRIGIACLQGRDGMFYWYICTSKDPPEHT